MYSSCVRSSMLHGSETCPVRKENVVALQRAEMRMVRWMCDVKLKDRLPSKELRERLRVQGGPKNTGLYFRLDNFVVQYVKIFAILSRKKVQNSHFNEFKYSLPNLLKSSQQLKLCYTSNNDAVLVYTCCHWSYDWLNLVK